VKAKPKPKPIPIPIFNSLADELGMVQQQIKDLRGKEQEIKQKILHSHLPSKFRGDDYEVTVYHHIGNRYLMLTALKKYVTDDIIERCVNRGKPGWTFTVRRKS
jgi:hypothetical protein